MRSSSLGPCLIVLAVGFCLALVVSFVWAEDKSKPQDARPHEAAEHAPAAHDAAAGHEEHHEPDPSDEVNDQHHWHLFDNSWFKVIFALGWWEIAGYKVPTKFMLIELIAAVVIAILMIALGRQMRSGEPVKGPFWNALEGLVLFI